MTLQEIQHTDCYVQFDTNEQLRDWVRENKIQLGDDRIYNEDVFIEFWEDGYSLTSAESTCDCPVYHYSQITQFTTPWWQSVHTMD